jgi:hypothetical protein
MTLLSATMMITTPSGKETRPPLKALCSEYLIFGGAKKVRTRLAQQWHAAL